MESDQTPNLTEQDIQEGLARAADSPRRRHAAILHAPGDELNRVVNFMMRDSYMQPHHHPGPEKIEHIHLIEGDIAVLFFDERGEVDTVTRLHSDGSKHIAVPAFTWHTYVMLADHAITYETMMGEYDPRTWKTFGEWAPREGTPESAGYLEHLKRAAVRN